MKIKGEGWMYTEDETGTYIHLTKGNCSCSVSIGHPEDNLLEFRETLIRFFEEEQESHVVPTSEFVDHSEFEIAPAPKCHLCGEETRWVEDNIPTCRKCLTLGKNRKRSLKSELKPFGELEENFKRTLENKNIQL